MGEDLIMSSKNDDFLKALDGKRISPLTLDNKWHQLFDGCGMPDEISRKADELNEVLKKQGNINNELKKVKALKKKLLDGMVELAEEASGGNKAAQAEVEKNKKLVDDCNRHIDSYQDELLDLPREIDRINRQLMLMTMDDCYDRLKENKREIEEISAWIDTFRKELKKNVVKKQDREIANHRLYSYMHDIFGSEVIEIFDMEYVPDEVKPSDPAKNNKQ